MLGTCRTFATWNATACQNDSIHLLNLAKGKERLIISEN